MSLAELENGQLAAEIQKVSSVNRLVKIVRSWIPAPVQDDRVASVHVDISDTGGKIPGVDPNLKNVHESGFVFDNRGPFIIAWTALMSLVCFYNLATLTILIFEEVHTVHYSTWLIANASTDFLLLLDIFVQSRTAFYEDGVKIYNSAATREKYASRWEFVVDIGAILPTDLLLFIKHNMSLFRSNRLLKCYRLLDFVNLADMRIQRTSAWSIAKVMITAIFIFHWNACGYYLMSTMLDIDAVNKSDWAFSFDKINDPIFPKCEMSHRVYVCRMNETEEQVDVRDDNTTEGEQHRKKMLAFWSADKFDEERYSNLSKEYVLSMYWSSMTITTLGEQPEPNFSYQNLYEIFDSVVGILLFAVIVGSVGDMVANSNAYTSNLRSQLDGVKLFMKTRQVDYLLQKKALNFFGFMINNRHVDDRPMKKYLPGKLRQAMQMCIHEDMLREVDLFKGSDDRLINELVGKLRLQFYCPHDEICKRGEQGKEMYIVKSGQLLAMSADNETVLFTIPEGCAFGELYLFDLPEHKLKNRRCTTIRSVGFTDLYVLHRDDFSNVLLDFPRTKAQLVKKAKAMLRRDNMFIPRQTASTIPGLLNAITMDEKLAVLERNLDNIGELIIGQQQLFADSSRSLKQRLYQIELRCMHMSRGVMPRRSLADISEDQD